MSKRDALFHPSSAMETDANSITARLSRSKPAAPAGSCMAGYGARPDGGEAAETLARRRIHLEKQRGGPDRAVGRRYNWRSCGPTDLNLSRPVRLRNRTKGCVAGTVTEG
jgi:hypothetical protein